MAAADFEGTCPVCFRTMSLTKDGKLARHGWKENGGRRVGSYGNAYHVGECFGVGYLPFEVSTAGTVDFFWKRIVPYGAGCIEEIARLNARPVLYVEKNESYYDRRTYNYVKCPYVIRYRDGERDYDKELALRIKEMEMHLDGAMADGRTFCSAVLDWAPREIAPKKRKSKIIHARGTKNGQIAFTACGKRVVAMMGGRTLLVAYDPSMTVTCPECAARAAEAPKAG